MPPRQARNDYNYSYVNIIHFIYFNHNYGFYNGTPTRRVHKSLSSLTGGASGVSVPLRRAAALRRASFFGRRRCLAKGACALRERLRTRSRPSAPPLLGYGS